MNSSAIRILCLVGILLSCCSSCTATDDVKWCSIMAGITNGSLAVEDALRGQTVDVVYYDYKVEALHGCAVLNPSVAESVVLL